MTSFLLNERQQKIAAEWTNFQTKFRGDFVRFFLSHIDEKETPTPQQMSIALDIQNNKFVSISSGQGVGKSTTVGWFAMYFFLCYPFSQTILTGVDMDQISNSSWKHIQSCFAQISHSNPWIIEFAEIYDKSLITTFYKREQWQIKKRTTKEKRSEGLSGIHEENLLFIVEEASGVEDGVFQALTGTMTQKNNRMILISQRTRPVGFFNSTFEENSQANGGRWKNITLSSEFSGIVEPSQIIEIAQESGGRESDTYKVRVKGEKREEEEGLLLNRNDCEEIFKLDNNSILAEWSKKHGSQFSYVAGLDVAEGKYRDSSVLTIAKVYQSRTEDLKLIFIIYIKEYSNSFLAKDLHRDVLNILRYFSNPNIIVDALGVGATTYQELNTHDFLNVQIMNYWVPQFLKSQRQKFLNARASGHFNMRTYIWNQRFLISNDDSHLPPSSTNELGDWYNVNLKNKIVKQMSNLPYKFNNLGKCQMESKDIMKEKLGVNSPDITDTFTFICVPNQSFVTANEDDSKEIERIKKILAEQNASQNVKKNQKRFYEDTQLPTEEQKAFDDKFFG